MKKTLFFVNFLLSACSLQTWAQLSRSDAFHQKYTLEEAVVFSRHNIRAPMAAPGSIINQVTTYQWHDFGVNSQELTMKGGVLETINGQFFHQWVVKEGLFPENAEPTDDELLVISNSKQRTISTARHFSSSFMPMKRAITVNHEGEIGDHDRNFTLSLMDDLTDADVAQMKAETEALYSADSMKKVNEELAPAFELLADVIDLKNSEAYKNGTVTKFDCSDSYVTMSVGTETAITGGTLGIAADIVDALILQYYEEPDAQKAAFGKTLTEDQWRQLAEILHYRDLIRFSSPYMQQYVSKHLRDLIAQELQQDGRKFTFLCGHDTNILNILKAMKTKKYDMPDAIEGGTPIASKIVFEKWRDASGNEYVAVNHVYQGLSQLRENTLLNMQTMPHIIPLQFDGITANEDGLFTLQDMVKHLTTNDDMPSGISSASAKSNAANADRAYTVSGTPASDSYRGITIKNGAKTVAK